MRKRVMSLLLSVILVAGCLYPTIITNTSAAATPTELFTNGKFVTSTGVIPDGWTFSGSSIANLTAGVDTTDKSPDGSNSFKFTQTDKISQMAFFYNTNAITLKTNADYVVTMWVKSQNIKSMRFYLFEPNYTDRTGAAKTSEVPAEGQNMYTYSYDNGSTHVCRTNITHTFKLNNATLASGPSSMAIVRDSAGSTQLDVSSDFPAQTGVNQWTKLTYSFTTSMAAADVATVRFGVGLKDLAGNAGSASIADLSFTETKKPFAFAPASNDDELGGVFPKSVVMAGDTQNLTFTAVPVDGNTFVKWTLNGADYSVNKTINATFSQTDSLKAVFEAHNVVTNSGAEKLTLNANVAPYDATNAKWTGDWFVLDYSTDKPGPSWATITVSNSVTHSGKQSYKLGTRYQYGGRKITGLEMHKDYYLSFWYYLPALTSTGHQKFNWASVVPGSVTTNRTSVTAGNTALGSVTLNKNGSGDWTCVTIPFNSNDNTEIQLITSFGTDDAADAMFIDDIGISSGSTFNVTMASTAGGTIAASRTGAVPAGQDVVFIATPDAGGSFLGWFDGNDKTKLISDKSTYVTTPAADLSLYAKFDVVQVGIQSVGLGGTATVSKTGTIPKGTSVTFTASPLPGNTFKGWYDANDGHLVSTQATYTTVLTGNAVLNPVFDGYNKPPVELLKNGSFETGTISGWFADDPTYGNSVSWCTWTQSTKCAYEGTHSLKVASRYRNSVLPINNLSKNTNYHISFYVHMYDKAYLQNAFIGTPGTTDIGNVGIITKVLGPLMGGIGWQKVEMYFNSGDNTSVNLGLRLQAETSYPNTNAYDTVDAMYLDNLELYEYSAVPSLVNGNFDDGVTGSFGQYTVTGDKEAQLAGEEAYLAQTIAVKPYTDYSVSFKAKTSDTSSIKAAVTDFLSSTITNKGLISSTSFVDAKGTDWTNYTFAFNSGNQQAVKLLLENNDTGTSLVDSIVFKEDGGAAQGIIENVNFESDRFGISDYYLAPPLAAELPLSHGTYLQSDLAQIYTKAPDTNDPNVRSGNSSLVIKYNASTNSLDKVLQQLWTSFPMQAGGSYRLTVWYRTAKAEGGAYISPDVTGIYGEESDQSPSTEWTRIRFNISNSKGYGYLHMVLGNIANTTASDIYLDDIVFQVAQPMVIEENTRLLYTELLYNEIPNQSFEKPTTDADWGAKLPSNMKIVDTTGNKKDAAANQSKYLHVGQSNDKYILSLPTKPGVEYSFGAYVRGKAGINAYIGITADKEGKTFFVNDDEQPASMVKVTKTDGAWHRSGFKFMSSASGYTNIVIDTKGGSIDIDNVMLFSTQFGYRYDPNDYSVYVPYNYDNFTKNTAINGGEGDQPYLQGVVIEGNDPGTNPNPSNGDNLPLTMSVVALTACLSVFAVFATVSKRRKEGANSDE